MFEASLLCLTAEPLCVHSLKFQVHLLFFEGGLSIGIWRKSGLCPRWEAALPFPSMTVFARAVHSSSNSVVLWVSSSARQANLQPAEYLQSQVFHVLLSVNAAQLHRENGHGGLSLHRYERRGALGLQAARGQGAEAAFANRQGRSMTERCCWSFVGTDDRTTLFKSNPLPGKWLVWILLWCLFGFANVFCGDSTGADSVGFNKKVLLLLDRLQVLQKFC